MKCQTLTVRCTELKAEWTSTIETAAKFPVVLETVVEVTCSDSRALKRGSSQVTCTSETVFTYSKEPFCVDLGKNQIIVFHLDYEHGAVRYTLLLRTPSVRAGWLKVAYLSCAREAFYWSAKSCISLLL